MGAARSSSTEAGSMLAKLAHLRLNVRCKKTNRAPQRTYRVHGRCGTAVAEKLGAVVDKTQSCTACYLH